MRGLTLDFPRTRCLTRACAVAVNRAAESSISLSTATAISVWTGLYEATSGSATVCGFDIRTEMHRIYGRCGVCPQFDILWPLLTVRETLRFYSQLKGLPKSEWDAEVHRAVSSVELSHASRRQVFRLSGGMKRRCARRPAPRHCSCAADSQSRRTDASLSLSLCPG